MRHMEFNVITLCTPPNSFGFLGGVRKRHTQRGRGKGGEWIVIWVDSQKGYKMKGIEQTTIANGDAC